MVERWCCGGGWLQEQSLSAHDCHRIDTEEHNNTWDLRHQALWGRQRQTRPDTQYTQPHNDNKYMRIEHDKTENKINWVKYIFIRFGVVQRRRRHRHRRYTYTLHRCTQSAQTMESAQSKAVQCEWMNGYGFGRRRRTKIWSKTVKRCAVLCQHSAHVFRLFHFIVAEKRETEWYSLEMVGARLSTIGELLFAKHTHTHSHSQSRE